LKGRTFLRTEAALIRSSGLAAHLALGLLVACASGIGMDDVQIPDFHVYFALDATDLDGRGHPQVAITDGFHSHGNRIDSVALLAGGSSPTLTSRLAQPYGPTDLAYGDLDGDGLQDLVVLLSGYNQPNQLRIYLQDGAHPGQFLAPQAITLPGGNYWLKLADLNGDGCLDILTDMGQPVVLFQDAAHRGSFLAPVNLGIPRGYLVCCDLDGDGRTDLAVASGDGTLRLFLQTPTPGLLSAGPVYALGGQPVDLCTGDLDGDSRPDLAVAVQTNPSPSSGLIVTYVHDAGAAASFHKVATGLTFSGGLAYGAGLVCADLDGDGKADLAYTQEGAGIVSICLQLPGSAVAFGPRNDRGGFNLPIVLKAFDLDGDGRKELIVAADAVFVLRQDPLQPGHFLAPTRLL
jgi:hypothetical protein